jgi:hypothetical protein
MIEIRATEGTLEESIGQGEFASELEEMSALAGVVAHRQRAGVRPGHEHIVAPAIDLHLVLVEAVHRYRRQDVGGLVVRGLIDAERSIRHRRWISRIGLGRLVATGSPLPDRWQLRQHRAVPIQLDEGHRRRLGDAERAREIR